MKKMDSDSWVFDFVLLKNNKIVNNKNYIKGDGGSFSLLNSVDPNAPVPNILIRKVGVDLVLSEGKGLGGKEFRLSNFFSADSSENAELTLLHPNKSIFTIDATTEPFQTLDDGSSAVYLFGDKESLAVTVKDYGIESYYEIDSIDESESSPAEAATDKTDDASSWLGLGLGSIAIIGVTGMGLMGLATRRYIKEHNETSNPNAKESKPAEQVTTEDVIAITGEVTLGPLVSTHGLSAQLVDNLGNVLQVSAVDASGSYTLALTTRPDEFTVSIIDSSDAPDYIDESTKLPKDLDGDIKAISVLATDQLSAVININPLTTIAANLIEQQKALLGDDFNSSQINIINTKVAESLLGESVDITTYVIQPIIDTNNQLTLGNKGGEILAFISALEHKNALSTSDVVAQLVEAMTLTGNELVMDPKAVSLLSEAQDYLGEEYASFSKDALSHIKESVEQSNAAPSSLDKQVALDAGSTYTFSGNDFAFIDSDIKDSLQSIVIKSLPAGGELRFQEQAVLVDQAINQTQIDQLTFRPSATSTDTQAQNFSFAVSDGSESSDTYLFTLNVQSTNQAPTSESKQVSVTSNGEYTFSLDDFVFLDAEGDNFTTLKIEALPVTGVLEFSSKAVDVGQLIPAADISQLSYKVTREALNDDEISFQFSVSDGQSQSQPYAITLEVPPLPVNVELENDVFKDLTLGADISAGGDMSSSDDWGLSESVTIDTDAEVMRFEGENGEATQIIATLPAVNYTAELDVSREGVEPALLQVDIIDVDSGRVIATEMIDIDSDTTKPVSIDFTAVSTGEVAVTIKDVSTGDTANTTPLVHDLSVKANEENNAEMPALVLAEAGEPIALVINIGETAETDTVTTTLSNIPAGSVISDGENTLVTDGSPVDVSDWGESLTVTPPADYSDEFFIETEIAVTNEAGATVVTTDDIIIDYDRNFESTLLSKDSEVEIEGGDSHTFASDDFAFVGLNSQLESVTITALPDEGQLTLDGEVVAPNQVIAAEDLPQLVFTPDSGAASTGSSNFTFSVSDGVTSSAGQNMALAFSVVNSAPTVSDSTFIINEDARYQFTMSDFGYEDVEGDALASIQIISLPEVGTLTLNEALVSEGQIVDAANIMQLTFSPDLDAHGEGYARFSFTANDGAADSAEQTLTFDVTAVNDMPVLVNNNLTINEGESVTLTPANLHATDVDNDDADLTFTMSNLPQGSLSFTQQQLVDGEVTYIHDGSEIPPAYDISVSDGNVSTDPVAATIHFNSDNDAPTTSLVDLGSTNEDTVITLTTEQLIAQATDAEDDTLTVHTLALTDNGQGSLADNGDGSWQFTPAENFNGNDVALTYFINDGTENVEGSAVIDVVAINDAPTTSLVDLGNTHEDTATTITTTQLIAQAMDAEGDTLSVHTLSLTDNAQGSLTDNGDGTWQFTPAENFNGNDVALTYFINDGTENVEGSAVIDVVATNDAPTTNLVDLGSTSEDTAITITTAHLIAQASDAEGDTLSVHSLALTDNAQGSLADNGDGSWQFTPAENFNGNDVAFTYFINDGTENIEGSAVIDVVATNDAPTTNLVDLGNTSEDTATTITTAQLVASASDAEGDTLTVHTLALADNAQGSLTDNGDGTWQFTPAENFNGNDVALTYFINDGTENVEGSAVIDVVAINDAPTTSLVDLGNTHEDTATTITTTQLIAQAMDAEGDTLSVHTLSLTDNAQGSLTDNGDGTWQFTPAENFNGNDVALTYFINDGTENVEGSAVIDVVATNDAPTTNLVDLGSTSEDTAITITTAHLIAQASDAEGDTLSVHSLALTDNAQGSLADNGDGSWQFTPAENFNGNDVAFTYFINDGTENITGSAVIDITAINDIPVLGNNTLTISEGETVTLTSSHLSATDIDTDDGSLLFTLSSIQQGSITGGSDNGDATVSFTRQQLNDGAISFTHDGGETAPSFTVAVTDGELSTPLLATNIIFNSDNDAPTTSLVDLGNTSEDTEITITTAHLIASATDAEGDTLSVHSLALTDNAQGSLADNGDGSWQFTPAENFNGNDVAFTYFINDGTENVEGSAVIDVLAMNDAPTTSLVDLDNTSEDTAITLTTAQLIASASDAEGDTLTVHTLALTNNAQGSLTDNGDGTWQFTPAENFNGNDVALTYFINDGTENVAGSAVIDVVAINDAPATSLVDLGNTHEDTAITLTTAHLIAQAVDVEGDTLTVHTLALTDNAQGSLTDNGDGTWQFVPAENFNGNDVALTYFINDGTENVEGSAVIDVVAINDAPTTSLVDLGNTHEDTAITITTAQLIASASDVEGDTLTVHTLALADNAQGSLADNGDGTWQFTPVENFNGNDVALTYFINDGTENVEGSAVIDITAINDIPVLGNNTLTISEGETVTLTSAHLSATDIDTDDGSLLFTLSSIQQGSIAGGSDNGDATISFTQQQLNDGAISFTHDGGETAPSVTVAVTDGDLSTPLLATNIIFNSDNDAPVTSLVDLGNTHEDAATTITTAQLIAQATDAEGDTLTIHTLALVDNAQGSLTDNNDGTWQFTPAENFNGNDVALTYFINDGTENVEGSAVIDVVAINDAPTTSLVDLGNINEDTAITLTTAHLIAQAVDVEGDTLTVHTLTLTDNAQGSLTDNGDGTWQFVPAENFNGNDVALTYFINDGTENVEGSAVIDVVAINDAPTTSLVDLGNINEDTAITLTTAHLIAQAVDVEGDTLTVHTLALTDNAQGSLTDNGDGTWQFVPAENFNGNDVALTYFINDGTENVEGSAVIDVVAINDAPTTSLVDLGNTHEDTAITITTAQLIASASDVEGDTLTVHTLALADNAQGSLADNGDGTWQFTPAENFNGNDVALTYFINDGTENVAGSAVIDVVAINDAPATSLVDLGNTHEDTAITLTTAHLIAQAVDVEGDTLTVHTLALTDNAQGSLTDNGDGTWQFVPAENFNGNDVALTYFINDGTENVEGSAVIDVVAINDAPTTSLVDLGNTHEDTAITITTAQLIASASDVEGDTLTVHTLALADNAQGSLADNGDGTWQFTPVENFNGNDVALTYFINDGTENVEGSAVIDITAINDIPVLGNNTLTISEGETVTLTSAHLSATDIDTDDGSLLFTLSSIQQGSIAGGSDNGDATISFTQQQLNDGAISFTHDGGETAPSVTVAVTDGDLSTPLLATNIIFNSDNDAPVTSLVDLGNTHEDAATTITTAQLIAQATDAEGDTLTIHTLALVDNAQGSLTDNNDGTWQFTPAENFNGNDVALTYFINDGTENVEGSAVIDVVAINDAPTTSLVDLGNINEDTAITLTTAHLIAQAVDVEGDTLTVHTLTLTDNAQGSLTDNGDGTWQFVPAENFNGNDVALTYFINDGTENVEGSAVIDVVAINDAPTTSLVDLGNINEDTAITLTTAHLIAQAVDVEGDTLTVHTLALTDNAQGSLTDNGDGTWQFVPAENFNGNDVALTYFINDGTENVEGSAVIDVVAINDAPTTSLVDLGNTHEDTAITITTAQLIASASDVEGDTLTVHTLALADNAQGSLADNGDGTWQFTPVENFNGNDVALTYFINDGTENVAGSAVIDITAINDIPVLGNNTLTISEGETVTLTSAHLSATDIDTDDGSLLFTLSSIQQGSIAGGSDNGDATISFTQQQLNDGAISFTHDGGETAPSVTVAVTDGDLSTPLLATNIIFNSDNDAPVTSLVDLGNTHEDAATTITTAQLIAQATDAEGDTLTIHTLALVDNAQGSLTDNNDGTWQFTPVENFNGNDVALTYFINDGTENVEGSAVIDVVAINDAPTTTLVDLGNTHEDTAITITTAQLIASASDVEGDTLTVHTLALADNAQGSLADNGDGTWQFVPAENFNGNDVALTYFINDGTENVEGSAVIDVVAINDAPTTSLVDLGNINEDTAITLTTAHLIAQAVDVEGDTLTVHTLTLTDNAQGSLTDNGDGTWQFVPAENFNGNDVALTYFINDGTENVEGSAVIDVVAINDAPTTSLVDLGNINEDTAITLTTAHLIAQAVDVEGDTLTVHTLTLTDNAQGSLTDNGDGTWQFVPAENFNGNDVALTYFINDGTENVEGSAVIDVVAINDAPTTSLVDLGNTHEDTAITITTAQLIASASDVEGDTLTVHTLALTDNAQGSLTDNGDGTWQFVPAENFNGNDVALTYFINDGTENVEGSAVIDVVAINDAPTTSLVDLGNINEDTAITLTTAHLIAQAVDVEGDTLTVHTLTLTDNAQGSLTDNGDGTWQFVPAENFNGNDVALTYFINDGTENVEGSAVIDVVAINDAPTTSLVDLGNINEDTAITLTTAHLIAQAVDVEGDTLTVHTLALTDNAQGSLTDNGDGTWQFVPAENFNGNDVALTYFINDGTENVEGSAVIDVVAINDAPTTSLVDLGNTHEDTAITITTAQLIASASDVEGDTLTVHTLALADNAQGSLADNGDGTWQFTPVENFNGNDVALTYFINDGTENVEGSAVIDVVAINDAPTTSLVDLGNTHEDTAITITTAQLIASASDVEGDTLTVHTLALADNAQGSLADNGDGTWQFVPAENFNGNDVALTYFINDGTENVAGSAVIDITAINDIPVLGNNTLTISEGETVTLTSAHLSATDIDTDDGSLLFTLSSIQQGSIAGGSDNGDATISFTQQQLNDGAISFTHDGGETAPSVTVAVTDGDLSTPLLATNIIFNSDNDAPVTSLVDLGNTHEDAATTITTAQLIAQATDAEGDTLTIHTLALVDNAQGSLTDNNDGTWQFTPVENFNGNDVALTYFINDGTENVEGSAVIDVVAINDAPTTTLVDLGNTHEDTAITITTAQLIASASDVEGDTLTVHTLALADNAQGSLADNGDGTWQFVPAENFNGNDVALTYFINDGTENVEGSAVIDVVAINDAPTTSLVDLGNINEDTAITLTTAHLIAQAVDVEGDTLTVHTLTLTDNAQGSLTDNGDGTWQFVPAENFNGNDVALTYFINDGTENVEGSAVIDVVAINDAPTTSLVDLGNINEDTAITLTTAHLIAQAVDVEGDTLTVHTLALTDNAQGSLTDNGDGTWQFVPAENFNGNDVALTYFINDGTENVEGSAVIDVVAINDAPTTSLVDLGNTHEDTAITITTAQLIASASDAEGDTLTVHTLALADNAQGSLADNGDGTWQFVPAENFNGNDVALTYFINDGTENVAGSAVIDITAINDIPVLGNNTLTISEGETVTLTSAHLSATDIDTDDGSLLFTLSSIQQGSIAGGSDNGDATISFTQQQLNDGAISFTHDGGETAPSVTVAVTDGDLSTPLLATNIIFNSDNDAPVTSLVDLGNTHEDAAITVTTAQLIAQATDAEGDTLTVHTLSLTDNAQGSLTDNNDGTWQFTPVENFNGNDVALTYFINDGTENVEGSAVIDVVAINDAPTTTLVDLGNTHEDTAITITTAQLIASASDVEGDTLTVHTLALADNAQGSLTDNSDGTWKFVPAANFNGNDIAFTYFINDGTENVAGSAVVDVVAVNDVPTTSLVDLGSTNEDTTVTITTSQLIANASDVEDDTLTVHTLTLADNAQGSLADNGDGTWQFVPAENFNGNDVALTYFINDGTENVEGSAVIDVVAINDAPTTTLVDLGNTHEDTAITITTAQLIASASDVEGDTLTVHTLALADNAQGSLADNGDGTWQFVPAENFNGNDVALTYFIHDGTENVAGSAVIDVVAINDVPTTSLVDLGGTNEDTPITITTAQLIANAADAEGDTLTVTSIALADVSQGTLADNGDSSWLFTPAAHFNGEEVTFNYFISDGVDSVAGSAQIDVLAVNDAPTASDKSITLDEDGSYSFSVSDFGYGDIESDSLVSVKMTALPENGSLALNGAAVSLNQVIAAADIPQLMFTPAADANGAGYDSIKFTVNDGQADSAEQAFTLDVTAVNDDPVMGNHSLTITEGETLTLTAAHLSASDIDHDDTSLTFTLSNIQQGAVVGATDNGDGSVSFTQQHLTNGDISFAHDGGEQAPSFDMSVSDGQLESTSTPVTMTFNNDNDAPVTSLVDLGSTNEDTAITLTTAQLLANATDVDNAYLSVSDVALQDASQGDITQVDDKTWAFTPAADFVGNDVALTFNLNDHETITTMDFNSGLEAGWSSVGLEIHSNGGSLGASLTGTKILELDDGGELTTLSYTVDMPETGDLILRILVNSRPGNYEHTDDIEVVWNGSVVETINPASSWEWVEVTLPHTGDATTPLVLREVAAQNNGAGPIIDQIMLLTDTLSSSESVAQIDVLPVNDVPEIIVGDQDTLAVYDFTATTELSGKASDVTLGAGATHTAEGIDLNSAGGNIGELQMGGAITIATTFTYDSFHTWARIVDFGNGNNADNIVIGTTALGRIEVDVYRGGSIVKEVFANNVYTIGQAFHVALTIEDDGHMKLYVDGELVAENANGHTPNDVVRTQNYIGQSSWTEANTNGSMNDLVIVDRALNANEITGLYHDVSTKDFSDYLPLNAIDENSENGAVVGTIHAQDVDTGDTLTFSLSDDASGRFAIDESSGQVTVVDGSLLDFEQESSHQITVDVSDGVENVTQVYTVTLNDVNDLSALDALLAPVASEEVQVNAVSETDLQDSPDITRLADDTFVAVWLTGGTSWKGQAIHAQRFDAEMNPVGSVFQINTASPSGDDSLKVPRISALEDGGFVVAFQHFNPGVIPGSRFRVFDNEGNAVTGEISLPSSNYINDVQGLNNGQFVTLGMNAVTVKPEMRIYDELGNYIKTAWGESATVAWQWESPVATNLSNGNFASVWRGKTSESDGVTLFIYDVKNGSELVEIKFGAAPGNHTNALAVEQLDNGEIVVAYNSGDELYLQRFSEDGVLIGDAVIAKSLPGDFAYIELETLESGDLLVGWTDMSGSNAESDAVFARQFNHDLTAISSEFRVNQSDTSGQKNQAMVETAQGDVAIIYQSKASGDWDITLQKVGVMQVGDNAATGVLVGQAVASDIEDDSITYSLVDDLGGRFAIDGQSGVITVADGSLLDHSVMSEYNLTVEASDGINSTSQSYTVSVVLENKAPEHIDLSPDLHFELDGINTSTTEVTESISGLHGVNIGTLQTGVGDSKVGTHAHFTGAQEITVANTGLDAEADAVTVSFWMKWDGQDNAMPISFGLYDIWIKGGAIGFNSFSEEIYGQTLADLELSEGSTGLANEWHHITAVFVDGDITQNKMYIDGISQDLSLVLGGGYNAGNMNIHQPMTIGGAGSTGNAAHNFTGELDNVKVFHKAITSTEAESIYQAESGFSIEELSANGSTILTALATDQNAEDTVTYSLSDDAGGRFAIDESTGQVSVADRSLLDYETAASHDVTVVASDGEATDSQTYTINITDRTDETDLAPEFISPLPSITLLGGNSTPYTVYATNHINNYWSNISSKLGNVDNFGSDGSIAKVDLDIYGVTDTVNASYLSNGSVYFSGYMADSAMTSDELSALTAYVTNGGNVVSVSDMSSYDAVANHFGLPAVQSVGSQWVIQDIDHAMVNGAMGLGVDLRGKTITAQSNYQGFRNSDLQADDVVIARDTQNNAPTIVLRKVGEGNVLVMGDQDIMQNVSGGSTFDASITKDAFVASMLDWVITDAEKSTIYGGWSGYDNVSNFTLTSSIISATDDVVPVEGLSYMISNLQNVSVSGAVDNGDGSYSFTHQALVSSSVTLTHNGGGAPVYDLSVSDGIYSTTQTISPEYMVMMLSGSDYSLSLSDEAIDLQLLEPTQNDDHLYYVLDANQDSAITPDDMLPAELLSELMQNGHTITIEGKTLALATEEELVDAGFITQDTNDQAFWVAQTEGGEVNYALVTSSLLDEQAVEGYIVFQVI